MADVLQTSKSYSTFELRDERERGKRERGEREGGREEGKGGKKQEEEKEKKRKRGKKRGRLTIYYYYCRDFRTSTQTTSLRAGTRHSKSTTCGTSATFVLTT